VGIRRRLPLTKNELGVAVGNVGPAEAWEAESELLAQGHRKVAVLHLRATTCPTRTIRGGTAATHPASSSHTLPPGLSTPQCPGLYAALRTFLNVFSLARSELTFLRSTVPGTTFSMASKIAIPSAGVRRRGMLQRTARASSPRHQNRT
jgi:hypothetical protein